jgi:catechol 2,3-dioxygenase
MKSEDLLANATRLGPVHLRVIDIAAALPLWRDVVGLAVSPMMARWPISASTASL